MATSGPERLGAVPPPAVQVFALGGFRVLVRGRVVDDQAWRRKTARQLFKVLLSQPNRRMTRDEVVELLWPESDQEAASSNLRSTLHALRQVLEPASESDFPRIVFSDRDSIWLRSDAELWVDADNFGQTVLQAWRSSDPLPLLEEASGLYAGHYLTDDLHADWAAERRDALKQSWAELQLRLSHELERRGDRDAAARPLHRLLQVDPSDERSVQKRVAVEAVAEHCVEPGRQPRRAGGGERDGDERAPHENGRGREASPPFAPEQVDGRRKAGIERGLLDQHRDARQQARSDETYCRTS